MVDGDGHFTGSPAINSLDLAGQVAGQNTSARLNNQYQLNLQRAQGTVFHTVTDPVTGAKTEYALVADYHLGFLENSRFSAQSGGKLGIIKDPFGTAEYLGSTTPIVSASLKDLSISPDGQTLWGSLVYWENLPSGVLSWNLPQLITAAEANSLSHQATTRTLPFDRTGTVGNTMQTVVPAKSDYGYVFGMASIVDAVQIDAGEMRYGDIGKLDLLTLIKNRYANATITGLNESRVSAEGQGQIVKFDTADTQGKILSISDHNTAALNGKVEAAKEARYTPDDFSNSGILFVAPTLDMEKLRNGGWLKPGALSILVTDVLVDGVTRNFRFNITVKDFANSNDRVFFGDRPLNNPGYSEFELSGSVAANAINDVLDVYRVEQRLAYLGFPAMYTGDPRPSVDNNVIQNFTVDGWFGSEESAALKLFEKVVRYESAGDNAKFNNYANGADGMIESGQTNANRMLTLQWLNAYNAPHWMQFFAATPNGTYPYSDSNANLSGWVNKQLGNIPNTTSPTNIELYGTSWMYDLMAAARFAPDALRGTPIVDAQGNITGYTPRNSFWFNGATDASYGFTPNWNPQSDVKGQHATHDLGMAFDLGVSGYIDKDTQQIRPSDPGNTAQMVADINALQANGWSVADALSYSSYLVSQLTPASQKNDQISAIRDFLSLYALTQTDGQAGLNGHIVNTAATSADKLFGGMITGVHIGDAAVLDRNGNVTKPLDANPYPSINAILQKLGIDASPVNGHQNHFHIYLKPPAPQNLPDNLLSDATASDAAVTSVNTDTQPLLDHARTLIEGETLMFTLDVPYVSAQQTPIVLAQATAPAAGTTPQSDFILNTCEETESTGDPRSAMRVVDPAGSLAVYFEKYGNRVVDMAMLAAIKTTLLQGTSHGKIFSEVDNTGLTSYHYDPTPNYIGNDQAVFLAEFEGKVYKIVVELHVFMGAIPGDFGQSTCPDPQLIKVKKPQNGSSIIDINTLNFASLEKGAVGQSDLTGITLDTNANGYGWYIDLTPGLNEEFLPTSNPYEWIAKPGSEAV